MVQYISWCKGLPESMKALSLLRQADLGIESRGTENNTDLIVENNVRFSSHNPAKRYNESLTSPSFIEIFSKEDILKTIGLSTPDSVGFHTDLNPEHTSDVDVTEQVAYNLWKGGRILQEKGINKKVIFETNPFYGIFVPEKNDGLRDYLCSPDFISTVLAEAPDSGYLFDVAHNFVAAYNLIRQDYYHESLDECVDDVIDASEGRVRQIHLNVPIVYAQGALDGHRMFNLENPSEEEKELYNQIFGVTKRVLERNPHAFITLEMDSGLSPEQHAQEMQRQVEYVNKNLLN